MLTLLLATGRDGEGACKVSGRYNVYVGSGVVSRICGEAFGSALTFGAVKKALARDSSGQKSFEWCLKSCMTFDKRAINFDEKLVALSLWMFYKQIKLLCRSEILYLDEKTVAIYLIWVYNALIHTPYGYFRFKV